MFQGEPEMAHRLRTCGASASAGFELWTWTDKYHGGERRFRLLQREKSMKEMMRKRMDSRGQSGFTLIELLVVIAILAILGGVAVFAVGNLTDEAGDSACAIEKRTMKTAVEAAKADNPTAPDATAFLEGGTLTGTYWEVTGNTTTGIAAAAVSGAPATC